MDRKLDASVVKEMLMTHFEREIELQAAVSVMELNGYELEGDFENSVDYADLDGINHINVVDYRAEEEDGGLTIFGTLCLTAAISGYVHWDGEDQEAGSSEIEMEFRFQFRVENGSYSEIELEYLL